jgi:hypothetical protein
MKLVILYCEGGAIKCISADTKVYVESDHIDIKEINKSNYSRYHLPS